MEIKLNKFRCFQDTGLIELKGIMLLVGENSSGKTSFLAGINHVCSLLAGGTSNLNSAPFELGSFNDIIYKPNEELKHSNESDNLSFSYECQINNQHIRWFFSDKDGIPSVDYFDMIIDNQENDFLDMKLVVSANEIILEIPLNDNEYQAIEKSNFKIDKTTIAQGDYTTCQVRINRKADSGKYFSNFNISEIFQEITVNLLNIVNPERYDFRKIENTGESEKENEASKEEIFSMLQTSRAVLDIYSRLNRLERYFAKSRQAIAFSPLRNKPKRSYLPDTLEKLHPDPGGKDVPIKMRYQMHASGTSWKNIKKNMLDFGQKSGLFRDVDTHKDDDTSYSFSILVTTKSGRENNIMDVGYGISQILPVIFEILSAKSGSTFLIQQPEVHLHPRAQAEFASLLAELSEKRQHKFIIETHSDFIIDRIKYEISQKTIPNSQVGLLFFDNSGSDVRLHQIELGEDGLPVSYPESYRKFFMEELDKVWP